MNNTTIEDGIRGHALDNLRDGVGVDCHASELHHHLFNEDYFIIGTNQAEEWLKNGPGVFRAIETIREYETENFGEVNTDFSDPEKVVNMYAYIQGERLLQESATLQRLWNRVLDQDDINEIIEELE